MQHTRAFQLLNTPFKEARSSSVLILSGYYEFVGEWVVEWTGEQFLGERTPFNYRRFYQDSDELSTWDEVLTEAGSSTFFIQGQKIVVFVLRDKNRAVPSGEELKTLQAYLEKPNPNTLLIVYFSLEFSPDDYKMFKKQKLDGLSSALSSYPVTWVDLDRVESGEIETWIRKNAERMGVKIGAVALARMFELWADEPLRLLPHVPKVLASVRPGQEVAVEDVETLVTGMTTHSIWDLIDAVEALDVKAYMSILKYLIISGVKPPVIVGTLVTHYNKVLLAKLLQKARVSSGEIGRVLKQPAFILTRFLRMTAQVSDGHLRRILELLYQLDYESKQAGEASSRLLLETFILELKALKTQKRA